MENSQISLDIAATTKNINLWVETISYDTTEFKFTTSIDDLGQIVLTPESEDMEFTSCEVLPTDADLSNYITTTIKEDSSTINKSLINLQCNMLLEEDNDAIDCCIDEIGQSIIYAVSPKNTILTASVNDSLELVTEEFDSSVIDALVVITNNFSSPCGMIMCDTEEEMSICKNELDNYYDCVECFNQSSKQFIRYGEQKFPLNESLTTSQRNDVINRFQQGDITILSMERGELPNISYVYLDELSNDDADYFYDAASDTIGCYYR